MTAAIDAKAVLAAADKVANLAEELRARQQYADGAWQVARSASEDAERAHEAYLAAKSELLALAGDSIVRLSFSGTVQR